MGKHLYYAYQASNFTAEMECICNSCAKVDCGMSGTGNMNYPGNNENSESIQSIHGKGTGTHFSTEDLLAYLHQRNQGDELWHVMHQHIATCPACLKEVRNLEQAEQLLKTTLGPNFYSFYPSITEPVMEHLFGARPIQAQHRFGLRGSGRFSIVSVALVVASLFIITFGSYWLSKPQLHPANATSHTSPTAMLTGAGITPQPTATSPMKQTVIPNPPVVTTVLPLATISDCTTSFDHVKQHLRICGSNFAIGDNLVLVLVNSNDKQIKQLGPVQIMKGGSFVAYISIHSCKDVPATIYAQDTSVLPVEDVTKLSNIHYAHC